MSANGKPPKVDRKQYTFNMALVGAAGLAGCLTVLILFVALFVGLWLDNNVLQNERNIFTVFLLVGSVPFTLAAMLWVVRWATTRLQPPIMKEEDDQEEADRV